MIKDESRETQQDEMIADSEGDDSEVIIRKKSSKSGCLPRMKEKVTRMPAKDRMG